MQIEQALFTSAQTANARGYHLVARSPGIDERLAQQLALWGPSENSLIDRDVDAESLNVFSPDSGWVAISRTVSADAEYSDRGQFRMETNMLVLRREQLAGYGDHPLAVMRGAMASGYLRLRTVLPMVLSPVTLPESLGFYTDWPAAVPAAEATVHTESVGSEESVVQEIVERTQDERLVIVGCDDPLRLLGAVYALLPGERRLDVSFSTGLKPSTHRPFRLQFLPAVNQELVRELEARGMRCLSM